MANPLNHNAEYNADEQLESLLLAQANALINGAEPFEPPLSQTTLTPRQQAEARDLFELAYQLRVVMVPAEPSADFMARLKSELVEDAPAPDTLLVRWRKLPAGYRLVARLGGMTIGAGLALLAASRALNALGHRHEEPNTDSSMIRSAL